MTLCCFQALARLFIVSCGRVADLYLHRKIHRNTVKNIYLNVFDYSVALIRNNEIAVQHQIKFSPGYTNQLRRIGCTLQLDKVMFRKIISMVYCNKCK